jgi:hypothetical protein
MTCRMSVHIWHIRHIWAVRPTHGLAGGLGVPFALALPTAAWVWTLPETRGIPVRGSGARLGESL